MSADSASRSPACARLTSAGLGSAMRHRTSVGRARATTSCAGYTTPGDVIVLQQRTPGCRLIEHETILHARRERRLRSSTAGVRRNVHGSRIFTPATAISAFDDTTP